jgi:hypothetical protein
MSERGLSKLRQVKPAGDAAAFVTTARATG